MGGGERHRWQRIVNLFFWKNNQHHHEVPDAPQFHDDDVADGDGDGVLQCHDDADGDAYGEPGALQCEENEASIAVSLPPLSAPSPLSA